MTSSPLLPKWDASKVISLILDKPFAAPTEVACARFYLQTCSFDTWKSILTSCTLKLRANPEAAMGTIEALLYTYSNGTSFKEHKEEDWESETIFSDLIGVILKQLFSKKAHVVVGAQKMLVALKTNFGGPNAILTQLMMAFGPKAKYPKASIVATSAQHRLVLYKTFYELAGGEAKVSEDVGSSVLSSLTTSLLKETGGDAKEMGLKALLKWMTNGLTNGYRKSQGYEAACDFLAQPCQKVHSSEFKIRIGGIFTHCRSIDTSIAIVDELWERPKIKDILSKGLVQIVESAVKKQTSNSVPQLDGLLATYMLLLGSCGSKPWSIPTPVRKLILSGCNPLSDKTSFLFSNLMNKGAASEPLIASVLSKIIALSSKILSQEESNDTNSIELINASTDQIVSASTASLAACAFGPLAVPQEIEASIQTVLMYSSNAATVCHALCISLSNAVNELGERRHSELDRLNRLAFEERELEITSKTKDEFILHNIPIVRKLALNMAEYATSIDDFGRSLVLIHLGTTRKISSSQRNGLEASTLHLIGNENCQQLLRKENSLPDLGETLIKYLSFSHIGDLAISLDHNKAAASLVTTLTKIAGNPQSNPYAMKETRNFDC